MQITFDTDNKNELIIVFDLIKKYIEECSINNNPIGLGEAIDNLGLSASVANRLKSGGFLLIGDIMQSNDRGIRGATQIGVKGIAEIKIALARNGLELDY